MVISLLTLSVAAQAAPRPRRRRLVWLPALVVVAAACGAVAPAAGASQGPVGRLLAGVVAGAVAPVAAAPAPAAATATPAEAEAGVGAAPAAGEQPVQPAPAGPAQSPPRRSEPVTRTLAAAVTVVTQTPAHIHAAASTVLEAVASQPPVQKLAASAGGALARAGETMRALPGGPVRAVLSNASGSVEAALPGAERARESPLPAPGLPGRPSAPAAAPDGASGAPAAAMLAPAAIASGAALETSACRLCLAAGGRQRPGSTVDPVGSAVQAAASLRAPAGPGAYAPAATPPARVAVSSSSFIPSGTPAAPGPSGSPATAAAGVAAGAALAFALLLLLVRRPRGSGRRLRSACELWLAAPFELILERPG